MTIDYHLLGSHIQTVLLREYDIKKPLSIKTKINGKGKEEKKGKVRYKIGKK